MARKRKARRSFRRRMFRRIVLAVDGSTSSRHAAAAAAIVAQRNKAELIVTSVVPTPKYIYAPDPLTALPAAGIPAPIYSIYNGEREAAAKLVDRAVPSSAQKKVRVKKKVLNAETSVADAITTYAKKQKADLIVVGTSSVHGIKRIVLGSVSSSVVNNADTSVLVVR